MFRGNQAAPHEGLFKGALHGDFFAPGIGLYILHPRFENQGKGVVVILHGLIGRIMLNQPLMPGS